MKVLLDTHALLWWLLDDPQLPVTARRAIADRETMVLVSAASGWEISTKVRIGRLPEARGLVDSLEAAVRREGFAVLPVALAHALAAGSLPGPHRDPFDRLLMAQARIEAATLVTNDAVLRDYGLPVLW
jgi:PIN domain nuclease of toxin-antitoxin system